MLRIRNNSKLTGNILTRLGGFFFALFFYLINIATQHFAKETSDLSSKQHRDN